MAVAVFEEPARRRVLAVRRPEEPGEELPGVWGLPAATVGPGETPDDAVRRLGRQKLGLTLEPERVLREGTQVRDGGLLSMVLFAARAVDWPPRLQHPDEPDGVTYYTDWAWAEPEALVPAAEQGSLCSQLFLQTVGRR
ncbi:MAG TPA: NUDIX domain-containing protein [Dehalococcoidia bacterium]